MDLRRMKYFIAIVEEGQISLAAKKLNISQPPLSQQLKLFEEELGTILFERNTRKLILTDEGRFLYEKALEIVEMLDQTEQELKELSHGITGTLNIGTIPSLGAEILPIKVKDFRMKYPEVTFQVWEGDPNRIMELLEKRIIELGIVRLPIDKEIFELISLPDEPMVAAMSRNLEFNDDPDFVNLADLKDKPLMLLRRAAGTSIYNQSMYDIDMVKSACRDAGFEPNIICESSNLMTLLSWANHDIGITIIPRSGGKLIPDSKLIYKRIINPDIMARPSALIWLKERRLSIVAKRFMEYFS